MCFQNKKNYTLLEIEKNWKSMKLFILLHFMS